MLTKLARSNTTSARLARQVQIVLVTAGGLDNTQIAGQLGLRRAQMGRWREPYVE